VSGRFFAVVTLILTTVTLKLEGDLDVLKMYLYTENEVARLRHSKLLIMDVIHVSMPMTNEQNTSQSQSSRSNVTYL